MAGGVPGLPQEMSPKKSGGTPGEKPVGIQGRRFWTNATITVAFPRQQGYCRSCKFVDVQCGRCETSRFYDGPHAMNRRG